MLESGYFANGLFYAVKFVGGQCAVCTSWDESPELESTEYVGNIDGCHEYINAKRVEILEQLAF